MFRISQNAHDRSLSHIIAMLAILWITGCASNSPTRTPWNPGPIELGSFEYLGAPLSGLREFKIGTLEDPLATAEVSFAFWALRDLPVTDSLLPLEQAIEFIAAPEAEQPVLAVSKLARGARYHVIEADDEWTKRIARGDLGPAKYLDTLQGWVDRRTTISASCRPIPSQSRSDLQILASGAGSRNGMGSPSLYIKLQGEAVPDNVDTMFDEDTVSPKLESLHEIIVIKPELHRDILFVLPTNSLGPRFSAIVAVVHIANLSGDSLSARQAFAHWTSETPDEESPSSVSPLLALTQNLINPPKQRTTLLHIAVEAGAPITESVAYAAPDDFIQVLGREIASQSSLSHEVIGIELERKTLHLAATLMDQEKLPVEVVGVLAQECGEAGRVADTLRALAKRMRDGEDLERRLIEENLFSLEDSDPSARVRAYDWLLSRSRAPDGYDPLSSRDERRSAINAFSQSQESTENQDTAGGNS